MEVHMNKTLPTLKSNRLLIRPINHNDCYDMYEYAKKDNVGPNAGWSPHKSLDETKNIIMNMINETLVDNNIGVFAIVFKENMKMIGTIGLHNYHEKNASASLGYVLSPDYWGRGLMVEAVKTIITFAFDELSIYRLECSHYDFNQQSKRVIEKVGFVFEGISRKNKVLLNGNRCDTHNYSILKSDWQ